jgi:hypothetical protein
MYRDLLMPVKRPTYELNACKETYKCLWRDVLMHILIRRGLAAAFQRPHTHTHTHKHTHTLLLLHLMVISIIFTSFWSSYFHPHNLFFRICQNQFVHLSFLLFACVVCGMTSNCDIGLVGLNKKHPLLLCLLPVQNLSYDMQ